jgi:hypothetical protein
VGEVNGKIEGKEEEGPAEATKQGQIRIPSNGEGDNQSTMCRMNRAWRRVKEEKENGGMTAVKRTCVARTRNVEPVKMCPFVRGVGNTTTEGSGAIKAGRTDSTLPDIGVTIEGVAHH